MNESLSRTLTSWWSVEARPASLWRLMLSHDAGEVISALQMAMLGGLRYQSVRDAVITHPTMGEGLNLLFDALDDGP